MNVLLSRNLLTQKCDTCPIQNRAICKAASHPAAQELEKISRNRLVSAGQTILAQESEIGFVGNVVSGVVKLSKTLEDGRQQVVGLLFPSDFLGRPFAATSPFSIEAATDVELCIFDRIAFETLLARYPEVEHELLQQVLTDLDAAREWMVLLGCQNSKEKLASFLLMLLRRSGHAGCANHKFGTAPVVTFPINRIDIAMFLGTTLETISRQLTALSKAGIVGIVDGHNFEILRPRSLALTAGHEEWLIDWTA